MEDYMSEEQVTEQPQPQAEAPNLSLQDLIQVVKLIQAVAQRGAIRAEEMSAVGGIHDRFIAFLEANGAVQRTPAPEAEPAPVAQGE
jgi:hypothetical protein